MRRRLWGAAAVLLISAIHASAAKAESACIQSYDLAGMGLKDYQDPMLSTAVQALRSREMARDVAGAMDAADTADDAVRQARQQADEQDARATASLQSANDLYSGLRLKMSDLPAQPLTTKCASAHAKAICSAMISRWEAQRLRQQATATPCYWDPSTPVVAPPREAPQQPPPATMASAPPRPVAPPAPPTAPPVPPATSTASSPADDAARLNSSVVQTSQAIDARNDAQTAAYKAARAEYEAELARQRTESAEAQRKHAQEIAAWKAQVEACKAGDYQKCTK